MFLCAIYKFDYHPPEIRGLIFFFRTDPFPWYTYVHGILTKL